MTDPTLPIGSPNLNLYIDALGFIRADWYEAHAPRSDDDTLLGMFIKMVWHVDSKIPVGWTEKPMHIVKPKVEPEKQIIFDSNTCACGGFMRIGDIICDDCHEGSYREWCEREGLDWEPRHDD